MIHWPLTRQQREALWRLFLRTEPTGDLLRGYRAFRRTVRRAGIASDHYVLVPLFGMWIGVEPDGYTHS